MYADALEPHAVRGAFNEVVALLFCCLTPGCINSKNGLGLVVYEALLAVHILGLGSVIEGSCREAYDVLLPVTDGNCDASAEEVVSAFVLQMQLVCNFR